jgi:proteasome lid subunit RPN8/RPN11
MSAKTREPGPIRLRIDSEVVRQIRTHARSENKTEVCGVLLGRESGSSVEVSTCIAGVNAAQGGAHVTFTQETWEHIYKVKDKEYPAERIVGWYHSHPGFGIFLSDHDTFIHKNFFSSPGQVAWVYDPLSDEEGCFGWQGGKIVRLAQIDVLDNCKAEQGGQLGEPAHINVGEEWNSEPVSQSQWAGSADQADEQSLQRLVTAILSHLSILCLGFALAYFLFPRLVIMAVPMDPVTGRPLGPVVEVSPKTAQDLLRLAESAEDQSKGPAPAQSVRPATPAPKDSPAAAAPKDGNDQHR